MAGCRLGGTVQSPSPPPALCLSTLTVNTQLLPHMPTERASPHHTSVPPITHCCSTQHTQHFIRTCVDLSMYSMRSGMEASSRSGTAISIDTSPLHTALRTAADGSRASVNRPCRKLQGEVGEGGEGGEGRSQ